MFRLFRKRSAKVSVMAGLFHRMGQWLEGWQRRMADRVNAKLAGWSRKQLVVALVGLCIVMGGASLLSIWQGFYSPTKKSLDIDPIKIPKHSVLPREESIPIDRLTSREASSIMALQFYLDSLQQTVTGRLVYDSLRQSRPGLLDSLQFLQHRFSEQLKISEHGKDK